jgi:protease II
VRRRHGGRGGGVKRRREGGFAGRSGSDSIASARNPASRARRTHADLNKRRDMEPETKSAMTSYSPEPSGGGAMRELRAPAALREPVEHVIHGDRRMDHYAWLKKKEDPRVVEYLKEENSYAEGYMKATEGFQEELYQEMLGRILQTDLSVAYLLRGYSYYSRTEEGKQYPIYCRRKEEWPGTGGQRPAGRNQRAQTGVSVPQEEQSPQGLKPIGSQSSMSDLKVRPPQEDQNPDAQWPTTGGDAREEVLLDLNGLAEGHSFLGLGIFEVSDDNQLLAYATDTTGFRQYTLEVKDLRTGGLLPFRVERVTSAAWSSDNRTLFYVVEDEVTKRSYQLWRHGIREEEIRGSKFKVEESKEGEDQERSPQGLKPNPEERVLSDLKVRPPEEEENPRAQTGVSVPQD